MKVLLHDNSLTERGTTVAVTEYARALQDLAGASVEIAYRRDGPNRPEIVRTLSDEFELIPYQGNDALQRHVASGQHDFFYAIKAGAWDGVTVQGPRNLIHAVFQEYQPHGERYAYVSKWLAQTMRRSTRKRLKFAAKKSMGRLNFVPAENAQDFEFVPHIVRPRERQSNFRSSLGIPDDAVVIGSLSGSDQFDLPFVKQWVYESISRHDNMFFTGPNLKPFAEHPRMFFMPTLVNTQQKFDYLHGLDVLIHARSMGETFGLAMAEALSVGTPVLSYAGGRDRNHIEMLGTSSWLYTGKLDLDTKLESILHAPQEARSTARELAKPFAPDAVMRNFTRVFLR